jgi:hypothetical protein
VALGIAIAVFLTLGTSPAVAIAGGFIPLAFWLLWMTFAEVRRGVRWCFAKVHMGYDMRRYTRSLRVPVVKAPRPKKNIRADYLGWIAKVAPRHSGGTPLSDDARSAIVKSGKIAPAHVVEGADPIADLLDPKVTTPDLVRLLGDLTDPNGLGYSVGISCVRSGHHDDSAGYGGHWAGQSADVTEINGEQVPQNPGDTKQFLLNAIAKDPFIARIGLGPALVDDADIKRAAKAAHVQVFLDGASHVHLGAK